MTLVAGLIGLAASAALVAPYLVHSGFCASGGGCDKVAQSSYAMMAFGVPRAAVGLVAFVLLLLGSTFGGRIAQRGLPWVGALFAIEGIRLFLIQAFVLRAFCQFCLVVDGACVIAGASLIVDRWRARRHELAQPEALLSRGFSVRAMGVLVAAVLVSAGAPIAVAAARRPHAIAAISSPIPRTSDGRVVLREYIDLECPFCRATHRALRKTLGTRKDVVVERHHVPLLQHPNAFGAAIAACCAAEQGAEEPFVDAIMLSEDAPDVARCRKVALELKLDMASYDACRQSDRARNRVVADAEFAEKNSVRGLPTLDIEGERHVGALDDDRAEALLSRHPR